MGVGPKGITRLAGLTILAGNNSHCPLWIEPWNYIAGAWSDGWRTSTNHLLKYQRASPEGRPQNPCFSLSTKQDVSAAKHST